MLQFYAEDFLVAYNNLMMAEADVRSCALLGEPPPPITSWERLQETLTERLLKLAEQCKRLPVTRTMVDQIVRVAATAYCGDNHSIMAATQARVTEIRHNLRSEIAAHQFYVIHADLSYLMEKNAQLFGEKVHTKFPDAAKDIAASGRCLALDEWTACVFHSMRVLEHGLRALADYLVVPMVGVEQWRVVIDQMEKAIRALEELPKGPPKTEKVQFCSEAASQFRYFKDAWRNHVSHSRASYDSKEADSIWNHTKEFMEHLAENL